MTIARLDHQAAGPVSASVLVHSTGVGRSAPTDLPDGTPVVIDLGVGHLVCSAASDPDTACPECVRLRWICSRPTPEREALLAGSTPLGTGRGIDPWADSMLAAAVLACPPPGTVLHVAPSSLMVTTHSVAASSDCPAPHHRNGRGPARREEITAVATVGRSVPLAELDLPEDELVGDCVGTLSRHLRETWFNPVAVAANGTLRERSIFSSHTLTFGMNGYGSSRAASRRLSLLEGLERHSGLRKRHDGVVRVDRFRDIADIALDPAVFGVYPPEHFDEERNRLGHVPWSEELLIPWVPALEPTTGRTVWVPQQMAYYLARTGAVQFVQDNSNGCAVGATLAEAFLGGVLEVVERDAFLVHWYARRSMPRISDDELSPRTRVMRARLDAAGFDLHLFDSRVDLRFPTVIAIATRRNGGPGSFAIGAGAALDPDAAVQTAVREAACNAPLMAAVYKSDPQGAHALWDRPESLELLEQHSLMYSVPGAASHLDFWLDADQDPRPVSEVFADWLDSESLSLRDAEGDVGALLTELGRLGLSPLVVDQTSEELERLNLRACRSFVPGLLPLDFGRSNERALSLTRSHLLLDESAPVNPLPHPFS